MPMKDLILVRHGEADHLVDGSGGGWVDTQLTELGRKQSRRIGQRIKERVKDRPLKIYSSDLSRAYETATIIGEILNKKPVEVNELRGLSLGVAGEMKKAEADQVKNPLTLPLFDWVPYQEAESLGMMQERVNRFMESVKSEAEETTVIVAHGNSSVAILYWWLGIGRELLTRITKPSFHLDPCSLTHVYINEQGKRTIIKLNDSNHLD
jgi:broad specificity phosphatase PhoE